MIAAFLGCIHVSGLGSYKVAAAAAGLLLEQCNAVEAVATRSPSAAVQACAVAARDAHVQPLSAADSRATTKEHTR